MSHALAEQRFDSYEEMKKWLDVRFAAKEEDFYRRGIHKLLERWEKCITSDGVYFEPRTFYDSFEFDVFLKKNFILAHPSMLVFHFTCSVHTLN